MIKIEKVLTKDFYPTMVEWWKGNNFTVVSPSILPEFTFVIYNSNGDPTYSMCFYNTDSNLAWVGWQLKNPKIRKEDRGDNLKSLFEHIEKYAKGLGYHILFTTSNTKPVENIMVNLNYKVGDVGVNHYIKQL
jgi:hypothetical protein